ncbi:acyl-CoA thioesterase [Rouxiella badensis]|jgi:acyl-CoA thioester hydrolase|uniref:acyl-CoA thioesterase n=1 Tax=Rouxiella badensis TaxID=1646377 RepID=UPI00038130D3|nr:thioesterase family protein [Rouxiella badensis]MCC3705069.1 acyl-CoA thioesterase [Rouxiella badensis]MCC3735327.1 acyl-CoA thioesterase [Rouxiella badensis]MCC3760624.1 acyl-CoA thioesterase [Rouxiella badensis]QII37565.1 acyl-CoA thioesterase [Rouxiella badensis]
MKSHNEVEAFRVSMRDIDLNGHVHNSVYLDYFEDAVVNQLRANEMINYFRPATSGVSYHVKKCEAVFLYPLTVDDVILPAVYIEKLGNSSLIFNIKLEIKDKNVICAEGKLIWVCVNIDDNKPRPIPDDTRELLATQFTFIEPE